MDRAIVWARRVLGSFLASALLASGAWAQNTYTEVTPGPAAATSSTHDGNVPANTLDNDPATRWSAQGDGHWIQYELGSAHVLAYLTIATYNGNTRRARFDIQVSSDGIAWDTVWVGESSGTTAAQEHYEIADVMARYVRLLGHGNSTNNWNSFTEVDFFASSGGPEPPTPRPPATPTPTPSATPTQTPIPPPPTPIPPGGPRSQHVNLGDDGRLVYYPYPNGDTIPDFSYAGYMGGGVRLPDVPVRKTIVSVEGDDGASIQAAIDEVSALPLDAGGFRGTVLLKAGTYEVEGAIAIRASGVVLRGEGDGEGGTVIKAAGTTRRHLITVSGVNNRAEVAGTKQLIVDTYVPVGARSFFVANAAGYQVGDDVLVVRTPNQEWIDHTGTDACSTVGTAYDTSDINGNTCISESAWTPGARVMRYERKVTAVSGHQITVDAPMVEAFQQEFGGGYLAKFTFPGRIQQVGIEHLRAESHFASDTDEQHALYMMTLNNVANAWVRNATSVYFEQGTILVGGGAKHVTVQDSQSLDHKSQVTGGRRYPFSIDDGALTLVMRCLARTGRHDYVTGGNTTGPNVFLDSDALDSRGELGPHHRWATGTLFDLILHRSLGGSTIMGTYNRGNSGSGHGWSGAYQLFWNCVGETHRVVSPPAARNWSIGSQMKTAQGNGEFESLQNPVTPGSLYLQQLKDRLGVQALVNIGYSDVLPVPTPTPTPTATPTPTPDPGLGPNLAVGQPPSAYTASTDWSASFNAPRAFDGNASTRWSAALAQGANQWLQVDLGAPTTFSCVQLREINFVRVTSHVIQTSDDGVTFIDIPGTLAAGIGNTKLHCFPPMAARYVRLFMHEARQAGALKEPTVNEVGVYFPDRAPVITVPADVEVEATGPDGAVATFSASAVDERDGDVAVTLDPATGSTFPLGTTTVTATATDSTGHTATQTFEVTVVDTTPPVISVPEDRVVEATGPGGAVVDFVATAQDLVSGAVPVSYDFPPGSTFPLGLTVVGVTASDAAENIATVGFTVNVVDTTPPRITAPPDVTITTCAQPGIGEATATDAVGTVTITHDAPAVFPLGTTVVTWRAIDTAGNVAVATQRVTAELGDDASCCPVGTNVLLGTAANDVLNGTAGSDCILGRGGDDIINALAGHDFISGGAGRDTIAAGAGNDLVMGGPATDTIDASLGDDRVYGGAGVDIIAAGPGSDTVDGGSEQDVCHVPPDGRDNVVSCP